MYLIELNYIIWKIIWYMYVEVSLTDIHTIEVDNCTKTWVDAVDVTELGPIRYSTDPIYKQLFEIEHISDFSQFISLINTALNTDKTTIKVLFYNSIIRSWCTKSVVKILGYLIKDYKITGTKVSGDKTTEYIHLIRKSNSDFLLEKLV